jgi:hypothetical protein
METYQMILIGIAGLIGLSIAWPKMVALIKTPKLKVNHQEDFMQIIASWKSFKGRCSRAGLDGVCEKLCEIFPMLIDADKPNSDKEDAKNEQ